MPKTDRYAPRCASLLDLNYGRGKVMKKKQTHTTTAITITSSPLAEERSM